MVEAPFIADLAVLLEQRYDELAAQVALVDASESLTFSELGERVRFQHALLTSAGIAPGSVVAVDFERSAGEVVSLLALIRAGAAWSAIDTRAPDRRVAETLALLQPDAVWGSDQSRSDRLRVLSSATAEPLDFGRLPTTESCVAVPQIASVDSEATAYVAFTSGSTGKPKGVVVPRRAVARLIVGAPDYALTGPDERYLRLAPLAFDASTFEIFCSLGTGSTLCIYDEPEITTAGLSRVLTQRSVTVAWFTAGLFRLLVDERPEAFAPLRQVLTGGDSVSAAHVRALREIRPDVQVTNGYGPTENTTFTSTWNVSQADATEVEVPIGRPIFGTQVLVLREDGSVAGPAEVGELYVAGAGLASGYLKDPIETAASFVTLPGRPERWYRTGDMVEQDDDGVLRFRGRRDRQAKVRGFRVEIAEVEDCLRADADVIDAEVFSQAGPMGGLVLVAAIVLRGGATIMEVRRRSGHTLPDYAVPTRWLVLETMPLSANGKVDHEALTDQLLRLGDPSCTSPLPVTGRAKHPLELRELIDEVTAIWTDVLGTNEFDDDESFFDVGGDSLSIAAVHNRLMELIPASTVRMVDLLIHPTVRDLADFLARENSH